MSKTLNFEITHVISFLNKTAQVINSSIREGTRMYENIQKEKPLENGVYDTKFREKLDEARGRILDDFDMIMIDYSLFNEEMSDLLKNKHQEEVIYSLGNFSRYYIIYFKLKKNLKKIKEKCEDEYEYCRKAKNYSKMVVVNKAFNPILRMYQLTDKIREHLKKITGVDLRQDIKNKD